MGKILYLYQKANIRVKNAETTAYFELKTRSTSVHPISIIIHLYLEKTYSESITASLFGTRLKGIPVNIIKEADDTVILADLQFLLNLLNKENRRFGLKIIICSTMVWNERTLRRSIKSNLKLDS